MEFLAALWLPILLSAVFVFIASSILHMVLPIHRGDYKKMPGEETVMAQMRAQGVPPGEYMFPWGPSMKEMSSPEMVAKLKMGPVGLITVLPSGECKIGKNLVQWFFYILLVSIFSAYIAYHGLDRGVEYLAAFRITGAVAILAYATTAIPNSIWHGSPWRTTLKFVFDGVIYGLVTAGTFGWLWPGSAS